MEDASTNITPIAFWIGGTPSRRDGHVSFMDTATASGANFASVNLFVSAGFLLSTVYGAHQFADCRSLNRLQDQQLEATRRDAERRDVAARDAAQRHDQAWQLTQQAEAAARATDCDTARLLEPNVLALDRDLHDTVFMRDAAIARCLSATAAAP